MKKDKIELNSVSKKSTDKLAELKTQLSQVYPGLFNGDGDLNKKELEKLASNFEATDETERYEFNWAGKTVSKREAYTPSKATLRPNPKRSVDFENTQNVIIEGENLEVLKLLQAGYSKKIKCIYIDPPYNKGKDFVYKDNYRMDKQEYWQKAGYKSNDGIQLDTNTETNGRYHSDWLSMMQSRLLMARSLLSVNGIIFVSIDDNEVQNLRKLMDEIFDEENFIGLIPTIMNLKGNQDAYGFAEVHEYFLVYAKSKQDCEFGRLDVNEEEVLDWLEDEYGLYKPADNLRATGVNAPRAKRKNLFYPIFISKNNDELYVTDDDKPRSTSDQVVLPINPEGDELSWYWSKKTFSENTHNLIIKNTKNGVQFYRKQRPWMGDSVTLKPKSVFFKPDYSTSTSTTKLKDLFGKKIFDSPKPVPFIKDIIKLGGFEDSIILDFFAGSGTTADAVMQLNAEDQGNRKYILVQIPQSTDEKSEAYQAGYKTISEICMERVRRSGKKITDKKVDTGFKVFELSQSEFPENNFAPDSEKSEAENIKLFDDYLKKAKQMNIFDSNQTDLLTEIAIKDGYTLNYTAKKQREFTKNSVQLVMDDERSALICLDRSIDPITIERLREHNNERFICLEAALDSTKKWTLKQIFGSNLWVV